jgi:SpoVK/Ycf46/Vps4 family AAA+-type ATPase
MRKGRLDEIFFIDLPGLASRSQIFRLHLTKRGEDCSRLDLAALAGASRGFSGAEIEQVVVSALYETRAARIALDTGALLVALRSTRPLSIVRAETIAALRAWASERCVPADSDGMD